MEVAKVTSFNELAHQINHPFREAHPLDQIKCKSD